MVAEKRLERLKKENTKGPELQAIGQALERLNRGTSLRLGEWSPEERKALTG